ncbi:DUF5680 domain-containing protein [Butyrivibrio sp. INlla21]|uniref:DUF5680 domain-containing protein n=1 Tax=Butyrivibrio sp. INlla21 TaxID=1520811 RepID=UPI0008EDD487|nr:DUF5680 domain-containing protein [Butyrivibrio sp. INlla21]SFU73201.1 Transcriptional regulator, contains XRE-family HTH domain [Butyrivibrio sp. INlla21]
MIFPDKLQILRKNNALTQEELAEKLGVSRQAVAKWEAGQAYPDIANLIQISDLMNVSVDYLVKDRDCAVNISSAQPTDLEELIAFRLEANKNTYAAKINEVESTRYTSHDFVYESGDFLKEALLHADKNMPYRGPEMYKSGEFTYRCRVTGDFTWFQGFEEIYLDDKKVYECVFHGGLMK